MEVPTLDQAPAPPAPRKPFGFWRTIGYVVLGGVIAMVASGAVTLPTFFSAWAANGWGDPSDVLDGFPERLLHDGVLTVVAELVGLFFGLAYLRRVIRKRSPWSLSEVWPFGVAWKSLGAAVVITVLSVIIGNELTYLLGQNEPPAFVVEMAKITRGRWLVHLWACSVGAASEELVFRGFMFRGLQESRVGPAGAIVLTALLWSVFHGTQYEPYWLFLIFLDGLILGVLRWRTNSLLPPILFHCLGNVVATVIFEINLRSGVY